MMIFVKLFLLIDRTMHFEYKHIAKVRNNSRIEGHGIIIVVTHCNINLLNTENYPIIEFEIGHRVTYFILK